MMGVSSNVDDMIGKKYGMLLVTSRDTNKNNYRTVLCRCDCGNTKVLKAHELLTENKKHCGCITRKLMSERTKKYPYPSGFVSVFNEYRRQAFKRALVFDITMEYALSLMTKNCTYCNSVPRNNSRKYYDGVFIYNGIDRVDNTLGYTIENTVTCCSFCNEMKTSLPITVFMNQIEKIYKFFIEGAK